MMISKTLVALCLALFSVQGDSMSDARELQAFRFGIALTEGGGKIDTHKVIHLLVHMVLISLYLSGGIGILLKQVILEQI